MSKLRELRDRRANIVTRGEQAVAEYNGIASDDDAAREKATAAIDAAKADLDAIEAEIAREESVADAARQFGVVERPDVHVSGGAPRLEDDPRRGFQSIGEFAGAVRSAKLRGQIDPRLMPDLHSGMSAAPTSYANESAGADGGYLVPPGFSSQIWSDSLSDEALLPRTTNVPVMGNGMVFPADEDTPWGSSGIQMYWDGEGEQATQSKPALKSKQLRLAKLQGVMPITEELAADANAISAYINAKAGAVIRHKFNDAILNGAGAGIPVGVVGHAGTVSVAKETSQTAATIVIENLLKMYSRAINPMRCAWYANQDTFPQLFDLKDNSGARVYQTTGPGMVEGQAGTLLGRPLFYIEECQTLGTVGDIVFGNMAEYVTITKGGVQSDTSEHLWFDYDVTALRIKTRGDGQPWRGSTLSPAKGSATRGNFVTVATRA